MSVKTWQEVGVGQDLSILMTMDEYDYCCIGEAPSDERPMSSGS